LGRNILPTLRAQPGKQLAGNGGIGFANGPPVADRGQLFVIPPPGLIGGGVPFGRVFPFVGGEGAGQGSDDGFGMLPADGLQGAPTVGDINELVCGRKSRSAKWQSSSKIGWAPAGRVKAAAATSLRSTSQFSMAARNSFSAFSVLGRRDSSTGFMVQSPPLTSRAWELLNASMAQKKGKPAVGIRSALPSFRPGHRNRRGPGLAHCRGPYLPSGRS
jgi:hypothetical protein